MPLAWSAQGCSPANAPRHCTCQKGVEKSLHSKQDCSPGGRQRNASRHRFCRKGSRHRQTSSTNPSKVQQYHHPYVRGPEPTDGSTRSSMAARIARNTRPIAVGAPLSSHQDTAAYSATRAVASSYTGKRAKSVAVHPSAAKHLRTKPGNGVVPQAPPARRDIKSIADSCGRRTDSFR